MVFIKVSLAGLVGVSLCMANISGNITDTGTTPIAGAIVRLEKGGQTTTTGADGSFTLATTSTAVRSIHGQLLPNGLSAEITGNLLNVSIAERTSFVVTTFDLTGKVLSMVSKTYDAGSHSILLPKYGAGVYLYKVKSGNGELLVKGNLVGGVSSESAKSSQSLSSNHLAKQAMRTASINDVLTVTKDSLLIYKVVVTNPDTSGITIKMIASAGNVTDVDGNVYQSVKIGNQVWMTENLRATKYTDSTAIPAVTADDAWRSLTTPGYCFYNNTTNVDSIKMSGVLYNWYVISPENLKKLAPAGWHIPTDAEWDTLQNYMIANGYNYNSTTTGNNIAKSMAAKTDWAPTNLPTGAIGKDLAINNKSGFSAFPGGYRRSSGMFSDVQYRGGWWSATENGSVAYIRFLYYTNVNLARDYTSKVCGCSIRLVKD